MKTVNEMLPLIKQQVKAGIWTSIEKGVEEYKIIRERNLK